MALIYDLVLLILLTVSIVTVSKSNNACENFQDYLKYRVSPNCFYVPDMRLETPKLVTKYAGEVESYNVTTEDGYVLTMFRMPRKKPRGIILLQHALAVNSRIWVGQGNESLAFYLWNSGYEIWMNNQRGTLFSEIHKNLSVSSLRYWDFSFHEIGYYDVHSQVELINSKHPNTKITYVGYSLGATAGLIYASLRSQEAKKYIKTFIFVSTPCYFADILTPLRYFAPYSSEVKEFVDNMKWGNVLLNLPIIPIARIVFRMIPISMLILNLIFALLFGWTPEEVDPAIFNFDAAIYIKGFSWKILIHYMQLIQTKSRFQMFDYGEKGNVEKYNSIIPPEYPLENISVPVFFMSSENDSLTTLKDTVLLLEKLPKEVTTYGYLKLSGLNHLDFFLGKSRVETFVKPLLKFLEDMS